MCKYIVLDLEWNQNPEGNKGCVRDLNFEIIEIGAVKLDADFNLIDRFHQIVSPLVYRNIHHKIYEITHFNISDLKRQGEIFPEACKKFLDWCYASESDESSIFFCTWGEMDLNELQKNMNYYHMESVFFYPLLYYDVQKLFYLLYCRGERDRPPLDRAVSMLGIKTERSFHNALNDVLYTAEILRRIDFSSVKEYLSLDYYHIPKCREEEIYLVFPDYSKYVSRAFPSKEEALADKTVSDMLCHKCRRMLKKKIRWFCVNQKNYYCLASCPEHGFVKGKIRMKSRAGQGFFAVKTMKIIAAGAAEDIKKKKEDTRRKRSKRNKDKSNY